MLLDEVRAAIGRYVVLPSEEALTAVTLWVAASHIQPALQHAPRLAVVGPTKGCGKSRVLDVLHETVHQPMMTVNTSPAVVFRVIGKNPPTLLVDEADTIFGPKTGEVTGYSLAAPGDTAGGEPVWYGGSKLVPDLSYSRLCERLPAQDVADRPQQTADPAETWRRAHTAIRHAQAVLVSGDDGAAQGHMDAFGDTLHNLALATHGTHRGELQAAARTFGRARRSAIRADHQAATALREAAKELVYATHDPGGFATALIFAALHLARAAAKWHQQRSHEQQAAAAELALRHLQAGYQQAAQPVLAELTRRAPRTATIHRFEQDLRAALPDHADRVLADPAWRALTTTLARAETAGHSPRRLLAEAAARRELETAKHPAEVLNWRITVQPNRRAQAARRQSTRTTTPAPQPTPTTVSERPTERGRHR